MAPFFRSSRIWVVDFHHEGRARRWLKALPERTDAEAHMRALLGDWYGDAAVLAAVRPATAEEERDYIQGRLPRNMLCPTGRLPTGEPRPPEGG